MPGKGVATTVLRQQTSKLGGRHAFKDVEDIAAPDSEEDDYDISPSHKMALSVRGALVEVDARTIPADTVFKLHRLALRWKDTYLEGRTQLPIYVNRNPDMLQCILDYHVSGELHLVDGVCGRQLRLELAFWGLGEELVSPCCLWKLRIGVDTAQSMSELDLEYAETKGLVSTAATWREKLWAMSQAPFNSKAGKAIYAVITSLQLLYVSFMVLASTTNLRLPVGSNQSNATYDRVADYLRNTEPVDWLTTLDFMVLILLTLVVLFQCAVCPERRKYLCTPLSILSMLSILVQWLPSSVAMFSSYPPPSWYRISAPFINGLKVARVVPVFYSLAPFTSMRVMWRALVASNRELGLLVVMTMICSLLFGYLVFILELSVRGSTFASMPDALWWGVVTLTTVGYGDQYPQSGLGRLVGIVCAITGIIIVALPVPIIAGNFTRIYELISVSEYRRALTEKAGRRSRKVAPTPSTT